MDEVIQIAEEEIAQLKQRKSCLEIEWKSFPKEQDLKVAAKELEKKTNILEEIECKVQNQKGVVEGERKSLDAVRKRVQEVCQKCYLPPRLDVFTEAEKALGEYKEELMKVQISYGNYMNGISFVKVQKEYLEGIDADLDDIRYDLNRMIQNEREKRGSLNSVMEQLALTDYEAIRERLEHCILAEKKEGYLLIMQLYKENPEELRNVLNYVTAGIAKLKVFQEKKRKNCYRYFRQILQEIHTILMKGRQAKNYFFIISRKENSF